MIMGEKNTENEFNLDERKKNLHIQAQKYLNQLKKLGKPNERNFKLITACCMNPGILTTNTYSMPHGNRC